MVKLEDLINLLIEINHNTNNTVMFEYFGHTEWFCIRFYKDGWKSFMDPTETHTLYLDCEDWEEEVDKLYNYYLEILNKDHRAGYDKECGF